MKTQTQVDLMRERINETKERIAELTGFSVERQNEMIFETGLEWLESIGCNGDDLTAMTLTPQFWGFWKMEWFHQDRQFLTDHRLWYHADHDKQYWYSHVHRISSSPRIEAGYHQVIKQLSKIK